jgi:hypothetical protein
LPVCRRHSCFSLRSVLLLAGRQTAGCWHQHLLPTSPRTSASPPALLTYGLSLFPPAAGEESFYRPPAHNLRHPFIFYYGHVAVFYVNKLRLAGLQTGPLNLQFEQEFEVGVDEVGAVLHCANTVGMG